MGFFNEFPHTRTYDNDLGWLIKTVKELSTNLENFIKLNTVKYADPIQWNISTQYEANTVVIDDLTGVAYISVQPVPSGVSINNTDYWTPVFTLDLVNLNKNITLRNDGNSHNATFTSVIGDWVIVGGQLYKVIQDIPVYTAYVVGYNIEIYTVELFIKDYVNAILTAIGDLDDLNTSDKTSVVNAINDVLTTIGDLNDLNTIDKTSVVNAINSTIFYVRPEMFGAVGDGVTDDTTAINEALAHHNVLFNPGSTYLVSNNLTVLSNSIIIGHGATIKIADNSAIENGIFNLDYVDNVNIVGFNFDSNIANQAGIPYDQESKFYNTFIYCFHASNFNILDCNFIGIYSACIKIYGCGGTNTIENCIFTGDTGVTQYLQFCIHLLSNESAAQFLINNNTFKSSVTDFTNGYNSVFIASQTSRVNVTNNTFVRMGRRNTLEPLSPVDVYYNADNVTIDNNYFERCSKMTRVISSRNVVISNNTFAEGYAINPESAIITIFITNHYGTKYNCFNIRVHHNVIKQASTAVASISITSHYDDIAPQIIDIDANYFEGPHRGVLIENGVRNVNIVNNIAHLTDNNFVEIKNTIDSVPSAGLFNISNNTVHVPIFVQAIDNVNPNMLGIIVSDNNIDCWTGYYGTANIAFINNIMQSFATADREFVMFTYSGSGYMYIFGNVITGPHLSQPAATTGLIQGTNYYNGVAA